MKKFLTLPVFLTLYSISNIATSEVLLDKIAVVVNDNIISETEINEQTQRLLKSLADDNRPVSEQLVRQEVINNLINEELKIQEARKNKINIDNITLNREIENIAKRQGKTVYQLYDLVTAEGIDYLDYREKIRREIAVQQVFSRIVRSRVKISDQEIIDYLNSDLNQQTNSAEYHLSHIMVSIPEDASTDIIEAADIKINNIYNDLLKGQDFADNARKFSDSTTSLNGGELGWLNRAALPSRFMQIILEMDNNNISKPFKTASGFNILKLHDIRGIKKHIINEVNARHILIKTNEIVDEQQAFNKVNDILKKINQGEDFGKLAKSLSEDKGSAISNGELGWSISDAYVPEFKQVIDELPINKVSQPVKTTFGWHIIEVLGRRSVDKTLEKSRNNARLTLLNRKAKEQEQLWVNQLRTSAYIDIREPQK